MDVPARAAHESAVENRCRVFRGLSGRRCMTAFDLASQTKRAAMVAPDSSPKHPVDSPAASLPITSAPSTPAPTDNSLMAPIGSVQPIAGNVSAVSSARPNIVDEAGAAAF